MSLDQTVSDFLRDASWWLALQGTMINTARLKNRKAEVRKLLLERSEVYTWMECLYDTTEGIKDGYNYLGYWTDDEIIAECERLRYEYGMNPMPSLSLPVLTENIVIGDSQDTGSTIPAGYFGAFVGYNQSNQPVAIAFPQDAGHTFEDILEFFS